MKPTRRAFLGTAGTAAAGAPQGRGAVNPLDAVAIARRHPLIRTQPTPDFFEGLLLGNGDIGACVTVRPDAMGIHIGKNDAWDIRVSEGHAAHIKTFQEVLELWKRAGEEANRQGKPEMTFLESNIDFFREYGQMMQSSYHKPWPRPWPCGTIWLHWDSRTVQVVHQELDIASGVLTVKLEYNDLRGRVRPVTLTCFVSRESGHISVSSDSIAPVISVAHQPNWDDQAQLPEPELWSTNGRFSGYQDFPAPPDNPAADNPAALANLAIPPPPPAPADPTLSAPTLTPAPSVARGPAPGNPVVRATVATAVPANRVPRRRSTKKLRRSHWESAPIEELVAYACSQPVILHDLKVPGMTEHLLLLALERLCQRIERYGLMPCQDRWELISTLRTILSDL